MTLPEGYGVETAKANLEPYTKQWVKTQPDMKQLRELDVIFSYYYSAPDGVHLFDFEVTPQDYQ